MILYSRWCALSLPTRHTIAKEFGIIKKGATEVASNTIKHDGFMVQDIESALTVESMQRYLQCLNDDMGFLFNLVVDKVEGRELIGIMHDESYDVKVAPATSILPKKEAKQFIKEYNARQKNANTTKNKGKN